jgi:hypothetical protein
VPAAYSSDLRQRVPILLGRASRAVVPPVFSSERQHRHPLDKTARRQQAVVRQSRVAESSVEGPRTTQGLAVGTRRRGAGRNAGRDPNPVVGDLRTEESASCLCGSSSDMTSP